jgi:hypothetical protein
MTSSDTTQRPSHDEVRQAATTTNSDYSLSIDAALVRYDQAVRRCGNAAKPLRPGRL